MEIFLDDAAPEVVFHSNSGGWIDDHRDGTQYPDSWLGLYSEKTFHATFTDGDYMQFRFNGTGITVFGSKRENHGVYGVKIDDEAETFYAGFSANPIFQTSLYIRDDLSTDKEHIITVTNYPTKTDPQGGSTPDAWLDIDHVVVKQDIWGNVQTTTIDDSSPEILYDASWASGVPDGLNYNRTIHFTSQSGGSMILPFTGHSIQIFSGINTDHHEYGVSLDGSPEKVFDGNHFQRVFQVPHYTASGLSDGPHTLKITNRGTTDAPFIGFDYAVVNSTSSSTSGGGSPTSQQMKPTFSPSSTSDSLSSGSKSNNVSAIAGGVVGGIIGLTVVGLLAWCLLCRKPRKVKNRQKSYIDFATSGNRYNNNNNTNNNSRSILDFEPKSSTYTSRSRMMSNASAMSTNVHNATSEKDQLSPSIFGSLRGMFKKRTLSDGEQDVATNRSDSPQGSITYLYTPNPQQLNRSISSGSNNILGTLPRSGQADSFDNQIYRNPPVSRSRPPIIPRIETNNDDINISHKRHSRNSTTSRSSAYSQGGETYLTDRLDNIKKAYSRQTQSPVPLPSPPSQESSEYEHMPLPPLPTSITINNALNTPSGSERPTLLHADASSTLLPAATIRQSIVSSIPTTAPIIERPVPTPSASSTNISPSTTVLSSQAISPETPGGFKRGILGLTLDTADIQNQSTDHGSSQSAGDASTSGRWINLTPGSVLDLEPPILSPPPDYSHAMTTQQQQQQ